MMFKDIMLHYTFYKEDDVICFFATYNPNGDGKFRVLDSEEKYLGYVECEDREEADKIAEEIDNLKTIDELLCYLGISEKVSTNLWEIHSYMAENEYGKIDKVYIYIVYLVVAATVVNFTKPNANIELMIFIFSNTRKCCSTVIICKGIPV